MSQLANLKKRIGQRLIAGFDGLRLSPELSRLDDEWGLGGYIVFRRNLQDMQQILNMNEDLWMRGQGIPPFISIDEEAGPVHRLPEPFTFFPDMQHLGKVSSVSVAYEVGAVIGRELTAAGFNLNFAPVLDINVPSDNQVIGKRSISDDPEKVTSLGRAIVRGLHDNSIIACGKHFPGLGATKEDSHLALPTCDFDLARLRSVELKPYQKLIQSQPHLDMVMAGHVVYPKIDPERPASLSHTFLQDVLRLELGFKGLIVTDDLEMKAIADHHSMAEATEMALEAGVDVFLVCSSLDAQVEVLETMIRLAEAGKFPKHIWERSFTRIHDVKANHFRVIRTIDRQHAREVIGNREHARIARRLRDGK